MTTNQPLTLTVEQAAQVLGIGRSTAYELVRTGDLKHIRLRRRIVVPVAHLAEHLGVDRDAVWSVLCAPRTPERVSPASTRSPSQSASRRLATTAVEMPPLF